MIIYTGHSGACSKCGGTTTFQNTETGQPQHVACLGLMTTQAPPEPRQPTTAVLPEHLEATAAMAVLRIQQAAEKAEGDLDKICKQSIGMVMDLFEDVRTFGRLPIIHHPPYPDVFQRATRRAAHGVWLAKHNWTGPGTGIGDVVKLDVPGAYLNAFICHLPIQALRHDESGVWSPRMAGVYRITPPDWRVPDMPNPLGDREEDGELWVTSATLKLIMWCADDRRRLCDTPKIHEAWTAQSSEDLLRSLRAVLAYLRSQAITHGDTLTREVVKDMYSKFYATIGDSPHNHRMKRPEWSAIIQAQAAANLWGRAWKLRQAGLDLVHVGGTDEIHVVGDWEKVFTNGHELTQMKIKADD